LSWSCTGYHDSVEMQLIHILLEGFLLILVLYRYSFKIDFLCHLSCTGYILADIMSVEMQSIDMLLEGFLLIFLSIFLFELILVMQPTFTLYNIH
jgi:hypothetical protein